MATKNQSDAVRQELNGTWQPISGAFNFNYTSIAGFPRLLLHHDGSLYVLAGTGAILWLKPEYQIDGGAWTDSGWGPDGGKFTFHSGKDGTISLHCNRPCFQTDYPAGTVINTRIMAKCSGSVVLCDSLLIPQAEAVKTWTQSDSHQWNDAEDDIANLEIIISDPVEVTSTAGVIDYAGTWCLPLTGNRIAFVGRTNPDKIRMSIAEKLPDNEYNFGSEIEVNPTSEDSFTRSLVNFSTSSGRIGVCHAYSTFVFGTSGLIPSLAYEHTSSEEYVYTLVSSHAINIPGTENIIQLIRGTAPNNHGRLRIANVGPLSITEYTPDSSTLIDAGKEDFDDCAAYIGEGKALYAIKLRASGEIGLYLTAASVSGNLVSTGSRVFPTQDGAPLAVGGAGGKFVLAVGYESSVWLLFGHVSVSDVVIDSAINTDAEISSASVKMYDESIALIDIGGSLFAYDINTRTLIASSSFNDGNPSSIANVVLDDGTFILPSINSFRLSRLTIGVS